MNGRAWVALKQICGRIEIAGLCVLIVLTLAMMIRDHLPASEGDLAHFERAASKSLRADTEYRTWRGENPHPNKRELRAAKRAILRGN